MLPVNVQLWLWEQSPWWPEKNQIRRKQQEDYRDNMTVKTWCPQRQKTSRQVNNDLYKSFYLKGELRSCLVQTHVPSSVVIVLLSMLDFNVRPPQKLNWFVPLCRLFTANVLRECLQPFHSLSHQLVLYWRHATPRRDVTVTDSLRRDVVDLLGSESMESLCVDENHPGSRWFSSWSIKTRLMQVYGSEDEWTALCTLIYSDVSESKQHNWKEWISREKKGWKKNERGKISTIKQLRHEF